MAGIIQHDGSSFAEAERELAPRFALGTSYPEVAVTFARTEVKLDAPLGIPLRVRGSAISVDAPLRPIGLIGSEADQRKFRRLLGEQGSFLEGKLLAEELGVATTSATDLLQRVASAGGQILNLSGPNDPALGQLSLPATVVEDIRGHLQARKRRDHAGGRHHARRLPRRRLHY